MNQIQYLMNMILQGLNHIHTLGFMHRDLKPSNLLLAIETMEGSQKLILKIADFG